MMAETAVPVNVRTGRIVHYCDRCHQSIPAGEKYEDHRLPPWRGDGANETPFWRRLTCHVRAYPLGAGCAEAAAYREQAERNARA